MVLAGRGAVAQEIDGPWPWEPDDALHRALAWRDVEGHPSTGAVLRAARAELRLGRPARARLILDAYRVVDARYQAHLSALVAATALAEGKLGEAARGFAAAAAQAPGTVAAVLHVRAAAAFEQGGMPGPAATHYLVAARELPSIGAWLRVRAARVTPDLHLADSLLAGLPPVVEALARRARAQVLLRSGDSVRAVDGLVAAGALAEAAVMMLALGDTADARNLSYRALREPDTTVARRALELVRTALSPQSIAELLSAARVAARTGDPRQAVEYARAAVAAGDSSETTLLEWAGWLERIGQRREALDVYEKAGTEGAYRRARALLRLGRRSEAARAFLRFVDERPRHRSAPLALYLAADITRRDSLFLELARRWPAHEYASRARMRLATRALRRADTAVASRLYAAEVEAAGREDRLARYMLARIRLASGDRTVALAAFAALARDDSVGYYGMIAREIAELAPPVFSAPANREPTAAARKALAALDLLDAAGLREEADVWVGHLMRRDWSAAHELLDIAEGLIQRRRVPEAIRLGWRATRDLTLNHPRVIRTVFPWPSRSLVEAEAREFGLDPYLLAGLIRQESSFESGARSRAGARGFMQLMPATARDVARRIRIQWNDAMFAVADANLHVGAAHLAGLLSRFDGAVVPAVAAYNAGGTPVVRWLAFPEAGDPALFVERIPYSETRGYVRTVLRNRALYRALYPPDD
ncbi:MAG: transglycosylase SLT domain-containing protein [Gemmatimonadetes bacterium]|nr:transglycosylase SLT domain-containing protein [Gemmatimonadota bacterium]